MWLITYTQKSVHSDRAITANTVLEPGCSPAVWLAGALKMYPTADTRLLFALEIPEEEGLYLRQVL